MEYLGPYQTSMIEHFFENRPLIIYAKNIIIEVGQGPKHPTDTNLRGRRSYLA